MEKNYYFLYGDSSFETDQAAQTILEQKNSFKQNIKRVNQQDYKNSMDEVLQTIDDIYKKLSKNSLFDEKYGLVLKDAQDIINKNSSIKNSEKLKLLFRNIIDLKTQNFLIILIANKTSDLKTLDNEWRKLLDFFEHKNLTVPYFENKITWVIDKAKQIYFLKLSPELAEFIAYKNKFNKNIIINELYKINLMYQAGIKFNFENVTKLTSSSDDFLIFKLMELIAYKKKRDIGLLVNQIAQSKSTNAANVILLRNLEKLCILKSLKNSGKSLQFAQKKILSPAWLVKKQWALVDLFSQKELDNSLIQAANNDLKIKALGNAGRELLAVTCQIAADRKSKDLFC